MLMKPDPGLTGEDQEDPEAEVEGPISAAEAATKDLGKFACLPHHRAIDSACHRQGTSRRGVTRDSEFPTPNEYKPVKSFHI